MTVTITIEPYRSISNIKDIPLNEHEHFVETFLEAYGIKWIKDARYPKEGDSTTQRKASPTSDNGLNSKGEPKKTRIRVLTYLWYEAYRCHKYGKKKPSKGEPGGKSGKIRIPKKKSIKEGCPARMKITHPKSNPNVLQVTFTNEHNHGPIGSKDDLDHLPLSKRIKDLVYQKLKEGFLCPEVREVMPLMIKQGAQEYIRVLVRFSDQTIDREFVHRDQLIDAEMVYTMYKQIESDYNKETE